MNPRSSIFLRLVWSALLLTAVAGFAADRPRLAVLDDFGGDPDDKQTLIRLMVYANEFDLEILMATAVRKNHAPGGPITHPDWIREVVQAYGQVLPNLQRHATGWPSSEQLLSRIVSGNPNYGRAFIGEGHDSDGSRMLVERIDAGSRERPLNIMIGGGQTDLAQALWRVKHDRGEQGFATFVAKFRAYCIDDQDGIIAWMRAEFPGMFFIYSVAAEGQPKETATYRGMYLTGDETLTSLSWAQEHILNRGPLGALYPTKTYTLPNPNRCMKDGDVPSWFFFLPLGGNDPNDPTKPGWGGQFRREADGWYRDIPATADFDPRTAVSRWRPDYQRDFAKRMAWCQPDLP